jgi:hypothetical protein
MTKSLTSTRNIAINPKKDDDIFYEQAKGLRPDDWEMREVSL